mgnify:CR=1 FL=1
MMLNPVGSGVKNTCVYMIYVGVGCIDSRKLSFRFRLSSSIGIVYLCHHSVMLRLSIVNNKALFY